MITLFEGRYRFLSNFYPCWVVYEGVAYPSSEHAYQAAKSLDVEVRKYVASLEKPGQTKRFGSSMTKREDWEEVKARVMLDILRIKFSNPVMREKLLSTKELYLVEGNRWHDGF